MIEGAEFLLTHRHIPRRLVFHFGAAAACVLIATWPAAWLAAHLPTPPAITLPWYLVLLEWLWASLPVVLAAELAAWIALTAYVALGLPRRLVWAVMTQREVPLPSPLPGDPRGPALAWLGAGGVGWALIAGVPVFGPAAAAVLACLVLGGAFVVTTLTLRGWSWGNVLSFILTHSAMIVGLGLGLIVSLTIPVVNLVALPCAVTGTGCLLLREPRPEAIRTNEGTVPCASPDK